MRRSFWLAVAIAAVVFVLPQPSPAQAGITGTCGLSVTVNFAPYAVTADSTATNGWAIPETDPPTDDGSCTVADVGQGTATVRISTTPSGAEHLATCEAVRLQGTGTLTLHLNDSGNTYDLPVSVFISGSLGGAALAIQSADVDNPFLGAGELATDAATLQQCVGPGISSAALAGTLAFDS